MARVTGSERRRFTKFTSQGSLPKCSLCNVPWINQRPSWSSTNCLPIFILLVCQLALLTHLSGRVSCWTVKRPTKVTESEKSFTSAQSENASVNSSSSAFSGSFVNATFAKSNSTLQTKFIATSDRESAEPAVDAFLALAFHPRKQLHHMNKRDETDDFVSAFGRGIGFFVGEPCMDAQQCNSILINVYCNKSTGKCECSNDFPVNVHNRDCVKAKRLGENCEYHESCKYFDHFSICDSYDFKCRCQENYYSRISDAGIAECVLGVALFSHFEWMPLITITTAIVLLTFLLMAYTLLRRLSKGTTNGHGDHGHSHTFLCTQAFGQLDQPLVILGTSSSYPNGDISTGHTGGHYSHHSRTPHHQYHHQHPHSHHNERRSTTATGRCDHVAPKTLDHCCSSGNNYHQEHLHHLIQPCPGQFVHEPYDERSVIINEQRRSESRNSDHHRHHHHHHQHQHHSHSHPHHEAPLNHPLYRSNSSEYISQVRPFSFAITNTRLANRRWSGSSIRSQSSLPSTFSFRSQSTIRNAGNNNLIQPVHSILTGEDDHQLTTGATATNSSICPGGGVDKNVVTFHQRNVRTSALITAAVSRSMPLTIAPSVATTSVSTSTSPVVSRGNKSAMSLATSTAASSEATHHQLQQQQQQQQQPESHFGSETNCSTFC